MLPNRHLLRVDRRVADGQVSTKSDVTAAAILALRAFSDHRPNSVDSTEQ